MFIDSVSFTYTSTSLSLEDTSLTDLKIYPNPSSNDFLTISSAEQGDKYVKFRLYQPKSSKMIRKPVVGYKMIKNSFGKKQLRPLINISIKIGNNTIDTIITLTTRSRMTYPVLIGRSTLNNNYRINPRKSFLTGKLD